VGDVMVIEEALKTFLLAQSGLTDLIGQRYYPLILPQECQLPAVTYEKMSGDRIHAFSADIGASPTIQLSAYGATYTSASAVFEQLRSALQNYLNTTMGGAGGLSVKAVILEDEDDDYETDSKGTIEKYIKYGDFTIWYEE